MNNPQENAELPPTSASHVIVHHVQPGYGGLVKTSWILLILACGLALVPFFGFASWFVAGPIFLATFIMSIIVMTRGGILPGILLLLTSMFVAPAVVVCGPFISSLLGLAGAGAVLEASQQSHQRAAPSTISTTATQRLKPDSALAHNNLGVAYDQSGKSDEAIKQYEEAL
jgi:tetratricopeptide (TPR) repeat protein